jgi:hypothetical protein
MEYDKLELLAKYRRVASTGMLMHALFEPSVMLSEVPEKTPVQELIGQIETELDARNNREIGRRGG